MITNNMIPDRIKFRIKIVSVVALLIFFSGCVESPEQKEVSDQEPIVVAASVERREINIGDKIKYTITVKYQPGLKIKFPEFGENLAGFAIKDFGRSPEKKEGNRLVQEQWYLLDTYVTGSYTIPAPIIKYTTTDGIEEEIEGPALTIEVKSLISEEGQEDDIRDIKPPLNLPVNYTKFIWLGTVALTVVILLWGVVAYFVRRQKGEIEIPHFRPAHEIAFEQLKVIRELGLPQQGKIEEYYVRLSDVVRRYLENRFNLRAPEMTTEEFLQVASGCNELKDAHRKLLNKFLKHCDLVKFARYGPNEEEIKAAFDSAWQLVEETKEPEQTEEKVFQEEVAV